MAFPKLLKKDLHTYVLATLLSLFIVFDVQIPQPVAKLINNVLGKVVIIILSLTLLNSNPLIGSLGVIAAYFLIKRSEIPSEDELVHEYVPSENKKLNEMESFNVSQQPITVEETVIKSQIPYSKNRDNIINNVDPLDSATYDAAEL